MATPFGTPHASAAEEKKDSAGFVDKMKQWQDQMSDKFRDTWQGWRGKKGGDSIGAASVDLREQKESYTVRLNLPERDLDKVDIKLDGDSLHIAAPAERKAGGYKQTITLSDVAPDAKLVIDRRPKDNLIVVTVPKSSGSIEKAPSLSLPDPSLAPLAEWDSDIFARMEKMRREMDRIFDESFKEFRSEHKGIFDRPRFGSSLDVQEEGGNYVVRAYLPDRNMENVNVTVEGQTLKIEAKAEDTGKKEDKGLVKSHKAHYAQVISLPGPVKAHEMKVDKKEGMLVVTVPKAS
jgi:HSP20 family molecular chaperone IbpA